MQKYIFFHSKQKKIPKNIALITTFNNRLSNYKINLTEQATFP